MTDQRHLPGTAGAPCGTCGNPLAADQRWCLECGTRRAGSTQPFTPGLATATNAATRPRGTTPATAALAAARPPRPRGLRRFTAPRPLAVAVALVFACGLALGAALGPPAGESVAAGGGPIVIARAPAPAPAKTAPADDVGPVPDDSGAADAGNVPSDTTITDSSIGSDTTDAGTDEVTPTIDDSTTPDTTTTPTATDPAPAPDPAPTEVGHVFTIVLAGHGYTRTFAPDSPAKYLTGTLAAKGQTLTEYHAIAHEGLPNLVAMVSGQPPTAETQANCPTFADLTPGKLDADLAATGAGCVYPKDVETVADQMVTLKYRWRAYAEDVDKTPAAAVPPTAGAAATAAATATAGCRHPAIGAPDATRTERPGDGYAVSNVPFLYFHAVIDRADCAKDVVALAQLEQDLKTTKATPEYSLIVPNLCDGGWAAPCLDGGPGGLAQADAFLKAWVPKILASPAFKRDGLLVVTFDQAPSSGPDADSTACCKERLPGPNVKNAGGALTPGPGGGNVGAVLVSPFIKPGTKNDTPYDHYALLASVEDLFGAGRLGYAGLPGVTPFGDDVFDATP